MANRTCQGPSTQTWVSSSCAPAGLGLQLRASDSLSGNNFGSAGLVHVGDVWQTPGYDTSVHKANLTASTSLGSLSINPAGGCK